MALAAPSRSCGSVGINTVLSRCFKELRRNLLLKGFDSKMLFFRPVTFDQVLFLNDWFQRRIDVKISENNQPENKT